MQKIAFFLVISFSSLVLYGMEDRLSEYSLDKMPYDILKEILDANSKINKYDLRTYTFYKDCIPLNEEKPLNDQKNNLILNQKTINVCNIGATYFNTIAILSLVNKQLKINLTPFKQNLTLTDEKILLRPDYFKRFFVYLMNIKGQFIIDGLDNNNNNRLYMEAYINFKERWYEKTDKWYRYKYPAIYMYCALVCPIKEYISDYTESTNTPIASAIKQLANDSFNFDNVHHLFNVISHEAFSEDIDTQKKLAQCLALCAYTYNHFNDFSYTEPRQIIDFKNSWGFDIAEFNLNFDMGPMDQASIPLHLIYDILDIKGNVK